MANPPDGVPYGSRWGYRTPSPDFARTAVEPLSPPPASTTSYPSKPPSFPASSASAGAFSHRPQLPPMLPRSPRAPSAAQPQQSNNLNFPPAGEPADKPLPRRENNPLDALADIALMHGASQLSPIYNNPSAQSPMSHSPSRATTSVGSAWPRNESAPPGLQSGPSDTTISTEPVGPRLNSGYEERFEPGGRERRAVSNGQTYQGPAAGFTTSRRSSAPAQPLQFSNTEHTASISTPQAMNLKQATFSGGARSRADGYRSSPDDASRLPSSKLLAAYQGDERRLDGDSRKSRTSLPTPTQDDYVVASSGSSAQAIEELPSIRESIANLTPELMESDQFRRIPGGISQVATNGITSFELEGTQAGMPIAPIINSEAVKVERHLHAMRDNLAAQDFNTATEHSFQSDVGTTRHRRSTSRTSKTSDNKKSNRKSKGRSDSEAYAGSASQPSGEDENCQTCKIHYSEDDGRNGSWIGCDGCKGWHHTRCVGLEQATVDKIDKFYCTSCEPTYGKSTLKRSSGRARTAIDYDALHNGSSAPVRNPEDPRIHPYVSKIVDRSHPFAEDSFRRVRPELVTAGVIEGKDGNAWTEPFIVPAPWNPTPWHGSGNTFTSATAISHSSAPPPPPPTPPPNGTFKRSGSPIIKPKQSTELQEVAEPPRDGADLLDMVIPAGLTVRRVAEMIGVHSTVPMMEVASQEPPKEPWTMGQLANYFENPVKETIYNCISCEVSNTPLGELISRPKAVRESDLVDRVWKHVPGYPKPSVGKYVLMSVKNSFTDFHVDFGGSSVFYHIYEGQKVFLAIPPTEKALKAYEKWSSSEDMNYTFLPDLIPDIPCSMITLNKGDTFFIPSGWIHAVYTPVDSLVVGGNFLTRNFYNNQMRVYNIEAVTGVPKQMRYPRYTTLMWACMYNYIESDRMSWEIEKDVLTDIIKRKNKYTPLKHPYTMEELKGLPSLIDFLYRNVMIVVGVITTSQRPGAPKLGKSVVDSVKKAIPWPVSRDPLRYLKHFARWCVWQRARAEVVSGGERVPDWAQINWTPPGLPLENTTGAKHDITDGDANRQELVNTPNLPVHNPDEFDFFPERTASTAATPHNNRGGSHGQLKRKADAVGSGSSKKAKTNNRNRQRTPTTLDSKAGVQYLKLADGSVYVKKLSNLGPPRIGCESCRLKKTGCKHKEEIRARGWCDDNALATPYADPAHGQDTTEGESNSKASVEPPTRSSAPKKTPAESKKEKSPVKPSSGSSSQRSTATVPKQSTAVSEKKPTTAEENGGVGPPAGYRGRKPSCDDCKILKKKCLHQDTWKLVQDKQVAAEARKARKKHDQSHRRQAKESKRKAAVQKQKDDDTRPSPPVDKVPAPDAVPAAPPRSPTGQRPDEAESTLVPKEEPDSPVVPGVSRPSRTPEPRQISHSVSASATSVRAITIPSADVVEASITTPNSAHARRISQSSVSPVASKELQKEYTLALHQQTSRPKTTITTTNKAVKRKSEDVFPQPITQSRPVKEGPAEDKETTFENLRQLSLGLRVRGKKGGEVY